VSLLALVGLSTSLSHFMYSDVLEIEIPNETMETPKKFRKDQMKMLRWTPCHRKTKPKHTKDAYRRRGKSFLPMQRGKYMYLCMKL